MRVFQAAGVADTLLPHTHPGVGLLFKNTDDEIIVDWSRDDAIGPMGWRESYQFYQPGREAVLEGALRPLPHATVPRGDVVTSVDDWRVTLANGTMIEADLWWGARACLPSPDANWAATCWTWGFRSDGCLPTCA